MAANDSTRGNDSSVNKVATVKPDETKVPETSKELSPCSDETERELKDYILAIHTLCDGLKKLAFDEIAHQASDAEKIAVACEYEQQYRYAYNSLIEGRFGGACPYGQRRCNGVCTSDPCLNY